MIWLKLCNDVCYEQEGESVSSLSHCEPLLHVVYFAYFFGGDVSLLHIGIKSGAGIICEVFDSLTWR